MVAPPPAGRREPQDFEEPEKLTLVPLLCWEHLPPEQYCGAGTSAHLGLQLCLSWSF